MYAKTHLKNAARIAEWALASFLLASPALYAQTAAQTMDAVSHLEDKPANPQPANPQPANLQPANLQPVSGASVVSNLVRLEGDDPESGIHYVRLLLTLPASADGSAATAPPRFTMECQEKNGKRELWWYASFGGVTDTEFSTPFQATKAKPVVQKYASSNIKMTFEGYIKWKPFFRGWAKLRSGELVYQNPGFGSPNMEGARWFMQYLNSLPGLRLSYAKPAPGDPPEVFFQTQPIIDEMKKTPACAP